MKKIILNIGIFAVLAMIILPTVIVLAADDLSYTVLAPLPGTTESDNTTTLQKYLPGLFKLLIGLSAVAAVLMIVIGGFQYISTDAIQKKSEGKERIKNAVLGLVLVISAWLILNTINPNLLKINLNIESVTTEAPSGVTLGGELSAATGKVVPWYPLSPEQVAMNKTVMDELKKYGVGVKNGPCTTTGQTTGCTNLVGMLDSTFRGVTDLKKICGSSCVVEITGGTEGGHKSHGPNLPPVDLGFDTNLDKYILNNQVQGVAPQVIQGVGTVYTSKVGNRNATFLKESNHWHVVFE